MGLLGSGGEILFGDLPVTVEAIISRGGERIYLCATKEGTIIHCEEGDLTFPVDKSNDYLRQQAKREGQEL